MSLRLLIPIATTRSPDSQYNYTTQGAYVQAEHMATEGTIANSFRCKMNPTLPHFLLSREWGTEPLFSWLIESDFSFCDTVGSGFLGYTRSVLIDQSMISNHLFIC